MKIRPMLIACAAVLTLAPAPAAAQMPVFDTANYSQNLLQAARSLEQINHQLQSLQNEATMLQDMARNLERIDFPQLSEMTSTLKQIDGLMAKAKGVNFEVGRIETEFSSMFPDARLESLGNDKRAIAARARLDSAMDSFRHSMSVQARVVAAVGEDGDLLSKLAERSQSAAGSLQAQQATNQLLALGAKQQSELEEMLAAEFRSQSLDRARRAQSEAEAGAASARFLGSGKAYSPN
jgi:P-type conjugative transfer protein TrbJ